MDKERNAYRLIDANFNRTSEGLRVCEDISRFILDNKGLNERFKKLRHSLFLAKKDFSHKQLLQARNVNTDVGRKIEGKPKQNWQEILAANLARIKEALRCLEEFSQYLDPEKSKMFQEMRFEIYEIEKGIG
ncbi:MAG: thiamine-phosphate pyrophosphorylase [Candidatus Omnitrophica bacterium]|nr:thiamine-phosphate pyrophosphorylase [Candidatus Omnitrophota bacterium]